ncbi:MAG TPA: carboxypeptidase-like regulatory domain-containing protein [Gemmatimonadaceae bacterium]|nr:carboxypeptidase-like regulatory domain-containing protein [Gemmatimonadaceae bacterium]
MNLTRFVPLAGLLAGTSCLETPTGAICRDPARLDPLPAGIQVTALDSVTMTNTLLGAKVVARQNATVADSVTSADAGSVWVGKVTGTYTVTITKAGYQPWTQANIDVQADQCGFIPVLITALLQPE